MKKTFLSMLLCLTVILSSLFSTSLTTYANESSLNASNTPIQEGTTTYVDSNGVTITEKTEILTSEEAISLLMEKKNISQDEAKSLLGISNARNTRAISYPTRIREYSYYGFVVEIGGMWEVWNEGSFRQFNSFRTCWTGATGSGLHTWNELMAEDTTISYPTTIATLAARGVLEIGVDLSVDASAEATLFGLGFSFAGSAGTTAYFRKTCNLSLEWNLYE